MNQLIASAAKGDGEDRVAQFLRDLDVLLGFEYADPQRLPLGLLAPYFARHADLGLAERISASYADMRHGPAALIVRDTVSLALTRCASSALGLDRSLVVMDAAHDVCPESFSDDLWSHLLFRQSQADLPRWLRDLALRLNRWDIRLSLPSRLWRKAVELIHPTGLEPFVRWGCVQRATDMADDSFGLWFIQLARRRLRHDVDTFREEEVDVADADGALDECEVLVVELHRSVTEPTLDIDESHSIERSELLAQCSSADVDYEFWPAARESHGRGWGQLSQQAA